MKSLIKATNRNILVYSGVIIISLIAILLFLPKAPFEFRSLVATITGIITICLTGGTLMLTPLLIPKISSIWIKAIIAGCIYLITMYSLWLIIDYGSTHPETAAFCFNIGQSCTVIALFYLILDKLDLIRKIKKVFCSIKEIIWTQR